MNKKTFLRLFALLFTFHFSLLTSFAEDYETINTPPIKNPMLWADVPDPDVIRVGDTFYLVSTTMHLMPGAPVMASKDLKNWETVGYIFDRLTDSPKYDLQQGTAYGRGQWATSLKYHNGKFYALTPISSPPKRLRALGNSSPVCATSTTVRCSSMTTAVCSLSTARAN